ncbi:hypothetical protein AMECASPLE_032886 [Ameca splendens]|uniref:Uncharacterized protein n=1 Tax=Ameca splendens TaxID=208324 RepID=A0ABV0ZSL2_9TELE
MLKSMAGSQHSHQQNPGQVRRLENSTHATLTLEGIFVENIFNRCPANRFSHLNCGSLQSYYEPLGWSSD